MTAFNRAAESLTGLKASDVVGKPAYHVMAEHEPLHCPQHVTIQIPGHHPVTHLFHGFRHLAHDQRGDRGIVGQTVGRERPARIVDDYRAVPDGDHPTQTLEVDHLPKGTLLVHDRPDHDRGGSRAQRPFRR